MEQAGTSLPDPPDHPEGADFPADWLGAREHLVRICRQGQGPWWFCSKLDCRFDLPQELGGTCYLATEPVVAFLEVLGPGYRHGVVSKGFLDTYVLYEPLHVPTRHRLADPTRRAAAGVPWRMTGELSVIVPYDLPQAWAAWFFKVRFDGLWYRSRHDPAATRSCVALFRNPSGEADWPYPPPKRLTVLIPALRDDLGIVVEEVPSSAQLRREP